LAVLAASSGAVLVGASSAWAAIASKPDVTGATNGRVNAIVQVNSITYVGGSFTSVTDTSGHSIARSNLAAFDSSGNPTSWNPQANGTVRALASDGTQIFAGGDFTTIASKSAMRVAAINAAGGVVWGGTANNSVRALAAANGAVYAGGSFTSIGGATRNRLAALSPTSGSATAWNPNANGTVYALAADSSHVFAGGSFTTIGGKSNADLAAISPSTGLPLSWASHPGYPVYALSEASSLFVAGGGAGGHVASYTLTGSQQWVAQLDGDVHGLALAGGEVVAGGHFNNYCQGGTGGGAPFVCTTPVTRHHILALSTAGTLDTTWHPSVNGSLGVFAAQATTTKLYIGGDFTTVNGASHPHFARFTIT
jgi:hypothetical protein